MHQKLRKLLSGKLKNTALSNNISNQEKNYKKLAPQDIILLSYPRSGNTWTRYIVADMILQAYGFATIPELPIDYAKIILSIYKHDIEISRDPRITLPYRLIKSHRHKDAENRRFIYVFRKPLDSLCSYFYYLASRNPEKAQMSIDEFCLKYVDDWVKHMKKAIDRHTQKSGTVAWVCYEQLHSSPHVTLEFLIKFLGLDRKHIDINKALENHSFENRLKVTKITRGHTARSTRKGKVGSSAEELHKNTQALIK